MCLFVLFCFMLPCPASVLLSTLWSGLTDTALLWNYENNEVSKSVYVKRLSRIPRCTVLLGPADQPTQPVRECAFIFLLSSDWRGLCVFVCVCACAYTHVHMCHRKASYVGDPLSSHFPWWKAALWQISMTSSQGLHSLHGVCVSVCVCTYCVCVCICVHAL